MLASPQLANRLNTALAHHKAGRLDQAEALYRQVRPLAPKHFDLWHLSGLLAYQQERMADAADLLGRAFKLKPDATICEYQLAMALLALRRTADAEKHFRHVLAATPNFQEGWEGLAYCLKTQDRLVDAVACHERAVALKPKSAESWYNYGLTLSLLGKIKAALGCHERALAVDPSYALGHFGRAQALHQLDRITEAIAEYGEFLSRNPGHHEARSYRLFALHNLEEISREQLFAEHVAYGKVVGTAAPRPWRNAPDPERRLRVAILSPDLREHSCAYFLAPLLEHLDRDRFELYLYHDHFREDAVSARLRGLGTVWRNFVGQPHAIVEKAIAQDAPDILIDLAGHTGMTNRLPLFAKRLAPVQITYLGYPNTTGVPAMDYRFTDAIADPEGQAEAFATETLVRFAPTAWVYSPPVDAPLPGPRPCLTQSNVTFGCFNAPSKISDRMLVIWNRILDAVPGSRLVLKGQGLGDPEVRARYHARLERLGVAESRIELLERTPDTKSHLSRYDGVDVALDTFPYNGTTTTCEALWMGVPVVSLVGDRHMARVGASLLTVVGHAEWLASDADQYVAIATSLVQDRALLRETSAKLRDDLQRSALLDHAGQAAHFGTAMRNCWQRWCDSL